MPPILKWNTYFIHLCNLIEDPPIVGRLLLGQAIILLLGGEHIDGRGLRHLGAEHLLEGGESPQCHFYRFTIQLSRSSKFLSAWRRPPPLTELHNDNQLYWIWVFCFCTIVTAVLVWWFLLTILSPTAGKSGQKQYPIKQFKKQTSVELIDKHYEGHQRTIFEDFAQRPILNLTWWFWVNLYMIIILGFTPLNISTTNKCSSLSIKLWM